MDLSEREDQSGSENEDIETRRVSKKIANVTLESDSLPESSSNAIEDRVRRKKRTKRKQNMDVDPSPRPPGKSESKYMDCDGAESHLSSSDDSLSDNDYRGREADDEQSDWVGETTPTRPTQFEAPFDRRVLNRKSQTSQHVSMQRKIEKFAREGGRGELSIDIRVRDRTTSALLQRYLFKYHLEVIRRHRGTVVLKKKSDGPPPAR